jgi:hypothetical protein
MTRIFRLRDTTENVRKHRPDERHLLPGAVVGASIVSGNRLGKIILIDEPPMLTSNPAWTPEERETAGSIHTPASLWETANTPAGPDGEALARAFIGSMATRTVRKM